MNFRQSLILFWSVVSAIILLICAAAISPLLAKEDLTYHGQMLNNQSALNSQAILPEEYSTRCRETSVYIVWGAGTTGGSVQVATAHSSDYTGMWAPLGDPIVWAVANKETVIQFTGVFGAIKTSIVSAITGGTVSTWAICN